jgi:hypothetical protein
MFREPFILIKRKDGDCAGLREMIILLATIPSLQLTRSFSCRTFPLQLSTPFTGIFRPVFTHHGTQPLQWLKGRVILISPAGQPVPETPEKASAAYGLKRQE